MATRYYDTPYGRMTENQVMQIRMQQEMERLYGQSGQQQAQQQSQGGGAGRAVSGLAGMGGNYLGYQMATNPGAITSGVSSLFGGGASAGAGSLGATSATSAASGLGSSLAGAGSAVGSVALPAAAAAIAAGGAIMGGHDALKEWKAGHGEQQGGLIRGMNAIASPASGYLGRIPGLGGSKAQTYYGAAMGNPLAIADLAGINFFSGKGKDQRIRDAARKDLRSSGFLDEGNTVGLADGSRFDIGKDAGDPRYNVDFNRAGSGEAVGFNQALGHIMSGGNNKLKDDLTGYLSNASMGGGDAKENAKGFISKYGMDHDSLYGAIHADQNLDQGTKDAMKNGLDELYGVGAYANKNQKASVAPQASAELLAKSGQVGFNPDRIKQLANGLAQAVQPQGNKRIPLQIKGKPVGALQAMGSASGMYPMAMMVRR